MYGNLLETARAHCLTSDEGQRAVVLLQRAARLSAPTACQHEASAHYLKAGICAAVAACAVLCLLWDWQHVEVV